MRNCSGGGTQRNSYCLVTATYNNNPSNYLTRSASICGMATRGMSLPGCKELMGTFEQTNMTDFHSFTETKYHLDLHSILGGTWQCAYDLKPFFNSTDVRGETNMDRYGTSIQAIVISLMGVWGSKYMEGEVSCLSKI